MGTRKVIVVSLIAVLMIVAVVLASNQFEAAQIRGVIIKSDTSVVTATVDLGNISSAASFRATGNGSVTVAEAEGLNVSQFLLKPWDSIYWGDRFYSYTVNFTIDSDTWTIPVVVGGGLNMNSWAVAEGPAGSYTPWSLYHLSQGFHTLALTVYGKTQVSSTDLVVSTSFFIDLSA